MNKYFEYLLIIVCAFVVVAIIYNVSVKETQGGEISLEYTCTDPSTETFFEFRDEIPCYIIVDNDTYDGFCIEVGEFRNNTLSYMTCVCETENRTEGLYAYGGPEAYPIDIYWNYTIMTCDTSTITGPESYELREKFGKFEVNETQRYVGCPWDIQYDCRLELAKQKMMK